MAVVHRDDRSPFVMGALIYIAAFLTLVLSLMPSMVPFSLTLEQAAGRQVL